MERLWHSVFILFLIKAVLGECEEPNEEVALTTGLSDEYEQIYHSIPTLFEYLLQILEDRPEILEKDDVTFFQEHEACEGNKKRKRETCEQCDDEPTLAAAFEALTKDFMNSVRNVKHASIASDNSLCEVITEIPAIKMPDSRHNNNKLEPKLNVKSKSKNKARKDKVKGKKRNDITDESFLGSMNWNKMYISPEEVEERALKVEQALEDHNKKKEM